MNDRYEVVVKRNTMAQPTNSIIDTASD